MTAFDSHTGPCQRKAWENLGQNLETEGIPLTVELDYDYSITAWNTTAGRLLETWLEDGTLSCVCDND